MVEQYELVGGAYALRMKSASGDLRSLVVPDFDIPVRAIFDEPANLTELRRLAAYCVMIAENASVSPPWTRRRSSSASLSLITGRLVALARQSAPNCKSEPIGKLFKKL